MDISELTAMRQRAKRCSGSSSEVMPLSADNISLQSLSRPATGIRPTPLPNVFPQPATLERSANSRSYQLIQINANDLSGGLEGSTILTGLPPHVGMGFQTTQKYIICVPTAVGDQCPTQLNQLTTHPKPHISAVQPTGTLQRVTHQPIKPLNLRVTPGETGPKQNRAPKQQVPIRPMTSPKAPVSQDSNSSLQIQRIPGSDRFLFGSSSSVCGTHSDDTNGEETNFDAASLEIISNARNISTDRRVIPDSTQVGTVNQPQRTHQSRLPQVWEQDGCCVQSFLNKQPELQATLTQNRPPATYPTASASSADARSTTSKILPAPCSSQPAPNPMALNIPGRKNLEKSSLNPIFSIPVSHASLLISTPSGVSESVTSENDTFNDMSAHVSSAKAKVDGVTDTAACEEQVTVVFDRHAAVLLDKLNVFRKKGEYCDLTIEIGKSRWRCHSTVVAATCPYLHGLMQTKSSTDFISGGMRIKLPSLLDEDSFSVMMDMIYTGRLCMSKEKIKSLFEIATYLKLSLAQAECEEYFLKVDSAAEEKITKIYSAMKRLQDTAFCTNISEATGNKSVESVQSHTLEATGCQPLVMDETAYSDDDFQSQDTDSTADAGFDNSVAFLCEKRENFTASESREKNKDKPTSSLTNLMRVASEAFKDLDQQGVEKMHEENERTRKKTLRIDAGTDVDRVSRKFSKKGRIVSVKDSAPGADDGDDYSCKQCQKTFSSQKRLRNHLVLSHSGKRHKCGFCAKTFAKKFDCKIHEQRRHTREKPYTCTNCGKGFHLNRELRHHVKSHQEGYIHGCQICKKTFQSEAGYKTHVASHGEKNLVCRHDTCKKAFVTAALRNRHEKIHSEAKPFQCSECDKAFQSNHVLLRHKKTHTGERPFKCDSCDRTFPRAEHLRVHMSSHSDERNFQCDVCHRTFKQKSGLNLHRQKHEENLDFVCDICGYSCRSKTCLKQHSLTHSSDKPFECDICTMRFKLKKNMTRHKKIHQRKGESDAETYKRNNLKKQAKSKLARRTSTYTSAAKDRRQTAIAPKPFNISPASTNFQILQRVNNATDPEHFAERPQNPIPDDIATPTHSSMDLSGNDTLFESLTNTVPVLMMENPLSNNHDYAAGDKIYFQSGDDAGPASWECSSGAIQSMQHPSGLPQESYLPVLTAEEVLAADGTDVRFSE